jgi:peptide subunit release factor 1 (eRF1)
MTGPTSQHGTRSRYQAGCKCPRCGSANNAYMRAYQHDRVRGTSTPREDVSDVIDELAEILHGPF